ncbi:class I SAM-dependent methyltransferase [Pseudonocardia sp.]|uniref:class I SAM-dependent methyltransferase n=1 Tax=Pseudonocardia sp. TaxID=60912 RepID=UPI00261B82FE|nr:class I SAM-dependent methyltransferase [Pseudonocardia sp.]
MWDARLSEPGSPECTPDWLALREPADAAGRAPELAETVRRRLPDPAAGEGPLRIRDLGCGTGSMLRWLAPRLPVPQHWVLHDRDPVLLARAEAMPRPAGITVETVCGDLTALGPADLAGTALVTASALLDLLDPAEVDTLAGACVDAGCTALWTLSVSGLVVMDPPDRLDAEFAAAFDDHQRRTVDGRRLLGPDAAAVAYASFAVRGADVQRRPSPWRLGAADAALTEEWMRGWVAAACVQQPELADDAADYLARRLASLAAGRLRVVVGHVDVLAVPAGAR